MQDNISDYLKKYQQTPKKQPKHNKNIIIAEYDEILVPNTQHSVSIDNLDYKSDDDNPCLVSDTGIPITIEEATKKLVNQGKDTIPIYNFRSNI